SVLRAGRYSDWLTSPTSPFLGVSIPDLSKRALGAFPDLTAKAIQQMASVASPEWLVRVCFPPRRSTE
ncbi:hypothetical protein LCGC14_2567630, partial [marine sediment metagenome]